MLLSVTGFFACSILILYHGWKLTFYGNLISLKTGLGKAWIGLMLMASVTSLPEMVISISSVGVVGSSDLAVGNVLGSCIFNLAVLSLLDAITPGQPILAKVPRSNVMAAAFGTILLSLVGIGLFIPDEPAILNTIGITSFLFLFLYFLFMRLLYNYGPKRNDGAVIERADGTGHHADQFAIWYVVRWYGIHAFVVILAALALPYFAEYIAYHSGVGEAFIGTLLLAASSSLPELAVSITAARMGSADMAVGNLFGSNIFNIAILSFADLFYHSGNILSDASEANIITVLAIIIMNSIAIAGLTFKPGRKALHFVAWDTACILLTYMVTILYLFFH